MMKQLIPLFLKPEMAWQSVLKKKIKIKIINKNDNTGDTIMIVYKQNRKKGI